MKTKRIVLSTHPSGVPKENNFILQEIDVDTHLKDNEILVELLQVSVDPILRIRMNPNHHFNKTNENNKLSGFGAIEIGQDIDNYSIIKVISSNHSNYKKDDILVGLSNWQLIQKLKIEDINRYQKVEDLNVPLSYYLSVIGKPGLTAYFGVLDILNVKEGETFVVSAASGSVGSIAGQIAKLKGCYVIGITGGEEKVDVLKEIGFDHVINYKVCENNSTKLVELLKEVCPKGIDCYFDNTSGFILDAVTSLMNERGRIAFCGSITAYNTDCPNPFETIDVGPRLTQIYILKQLKAQGYTVSSYASQFSKAIKEIEGWINEGKIKVLETIDKGFENIPKAFVKLFNGDKIGKIIVEIK
ncbi:hypothetical protein ABK040_015164 [Willaertia magna]